MDAVQQDFPILSTCFTQKGGSKRLVYLDNPATTQKPRIVIDTVHRYYETYNANVHRGMHKLSEKATRLYEEARKKVARFINARPEEIVFTRGTTDSLNLLAYTLVPQCTPGEEIVVSEMEHHSNFVPWQQLAKKHGRVFKTIPVTKEGLLDKAALEQLITPKTRIVSITHLSNSIGTLNNIPAIRKIATKHNAIFILDAAQSAPHLPLDVVELGVDFLVFSGHKLYGPTGIGILYGKHDVLKKLPPYQYGGEMIQEVTAKTTTLKNVPWRFEAGTPNIAGALGLGAALDYLHKTGWATIQKKERDLLSYAYDQLSSINHLTLYGPTDLNQRCAVISFNVKGIHPHDLATLLDKEGVAVRGGHHCTMPLMNRLGINGTTRIGIALYTTKEDIDLLVRAIRKAKKVFGVE